MITFYIVSAFFFFVCLPSPLIERVPGVVDVKRILILHIGILGFDQTILVKGEVVTKPTGLEQTTVTKSSFIEWEGNAPPCESTP